MGMGCQIRGMVSFAFCICLLTFCAGIMTEAPKRNSTRERKPNRFLQLDDFDPPNHSVTRLPEPRDSRTTSEINQLAKLLLRFVLTANKKFRQQPDRDPEDDSSMHLGMGKDAQRTPASTTKGGDRRATAGQAGQQGRRGQDVRKVPHEETPKSGNKGVERKAQPTARTPQTGTGSNDHDLNGTKGKLPSSDTAGTVGPQFQGKCGVKQQGRQRKKKSGAAFEQSNKKQDLKPFKRQSYHVAIAYHIYLKQTRPTDGTEAPSTSKGIDPTYNARKLRETQEKQP